MEQLSWEKVFSGKFVFTVITALVFSYAVYAKILTGEQVYGVIMLVVAFYFNKNQETQAQPKDSDVSITSTETVKVEPKKEDSK